MTTRVNDILDRIASELDAKPGNRYRRLPEVNERLLKSVRGMVKDFDPLDRKELATLKTLEKKWRVAWELETSSMDPKAQWMEQTNQAAKSILDGVDMSGRRLLSLEGFQAHCRELTNATKETRARIYTEARPLVQKVFDTYHEVLKDRMIDIEHNDRRQADVLGMPYQASPEFQAVEAVARWSKDKRWIDGGNASPTSMLMNVITL